MTQRELRNILVSLLAKYLEGPAVALSDQAMPESAYPYIYYQAVQQRIPGPYNIKEKPGAGELRQSREEHTKATYSFTACSIGRKDSDGAWISGEDEALELADKAQGFFLFSGRQLLADHGVTVVGVENTQSRSALDIDETDRRYGFDVLVRYLRTDTRTVPAMEPPITTMNKEE